MTDLIANYGYLAVLVGTALEGETVVVLAALAAKLGYLNIWLVVLSAFVGSFVGDQFYFWIGRTYGPALLDRWPTWKRRVSRASRLLEKYDWAFILSFRFLYGLRSISPFVIGMSDVSAQRFMILNCIAAILWAVVVGFASLAMSAVIEKIIDKFQILEHYALLFIALVGLLVWLWHWYRTRKHTHTAS